jgi:hypothetical protein
MASTPTPAPPISVTATSAVLTSWTPPPTTIAPVMPGWMLQAKGSMPASSERPVVPLALDERSGHLLVVSGDVVRERVEVLEDPRLPRSTPVTVGVKQKSTIFTTVPEPSVDRSS